MVNQITSLKLKKLQAITNKVRVTNAMACEMLNTVIFKHPSSKFCDKRCIVIRIIAVDLSRYYGISLLMQPSAHHAHTHVFID